MNRQSHESSPFFLHLWASPSQSHCICRSWHSFLVSWVQRQRPETTNCRMDDARWHGRSVWTSHNWPAAASWHFAFSSATADEGARRSCCLSPCSSQDTTALQPFLGSHQFVFPYHRIWRRCIDWHSLWFLVKSFVQQELEMLGLAHSHSLRRQHHVLFRRIPFGFYLPWKPLDSCLKHSMIQWEDHSPSNGCQEHCGQDRWIPMWQCAKLKESWRWHWKLPWHQPNLDWSVKGNEPQAQCRSKKWSRHCRQTELWHLLAHLWKAEGKNKLALKSRMPWHPPCSNNDMTWNGFPQQWTQFSPK